ncbi:S1 domain-containing post-transcriptional regulator GSP13 [Oceanobacillus sp. AG]|uniref:S1 domain-containing post-transcriptional regulator GSP13 n=1 Tax=Oceanobacillus sp. AG TaxID=2681969 RepID=UPI0012EC8965|nr:S1 domain-containing post-transcriptional regulator GSP13 [Oceanobacillus sp. AG]
MNKSLEKGKIVDGKVTGIQPYGAFVQLDEETQGLVHISEITHGFVNDINDHLKIGDEVKVKILEVNEAENKVSLSIRATEEAPTKETQAKSSTNNQTVSNDSTTGFNTLRDKLQEWIKQSENK